MTRFTCWNCKHRVKMIVIRKEENITFKNEWGKRVKKRGIVTYFRCPNCMSESKRTWKKKQTQQ